MTQDFEVRKQVLQNRFKWVAGIVGVLILAPLTTSILWGMLGAFALLVGGVTGFIAIQLAPVFATKIANLRIKMLVAEANKNPIETMQNIYLENMETIKAKDEKIIQFEGRLGDYKSKMAVFAKRYPDEAEQYELVGNKLTGLLTRQKQKQKAAKLAAREYNDQIEKASAIYDMACEAHAVTALAGSIEKQVFQEIRKQVAFDSVNHKFNTAVAELSLEVDTEPDFQIPGSSVAAPQLSSTAGAKEAGK